MRKKISTFIYIMLALLITSCSSPVSSSVNNEENTDKGVTMNNTFYNPLVIDKGMGDPWLYFHDGYYYYTQSEGNRIRITKSKFMTQLTSNNSDESITKIIFRQKSINVVEIWAPEIFFFNGHWYVYFTATIDDSETIVKDTNRRTYGMKSKTTDALGEWEAAVKIDLPCDYRSIDATFMDYNGKQYIIWSGWPEASNSNYKQNLYITELEQNNPLKPKSTTCSERHLISEPLYQYETSSVSQNEGPAVTFSPSGKPVIFYSGNYSGNDSYCISYLLYNGGNILDRSSWTKPDKPLMKTDMAYSEVIAPGHCSIVKSPDQSEYWIMYHAAKYSGSGWDRMARLQKLEWKNDVPVVEKISKFSDEVELPSGEVVKRVKYEAEEAILSDDCYVIDKTGYASNGKAVSISEDGEIRFDIRVPANGPYVVQVRFSNRDSLSNEIIAFVNGDEIKAFAPNTQYDDSFIITSFYTDLYVKREGVNTIILKCDSSIYIDCIIIDYLLNN